MAIRETELYCVAADGLDAFDLDLLLADLEHLLAGSVATHFGRRGKDAQELERQTELLAVGESDFQYPRLLVQRDGGGYCGLSI